MLRGSAKQSFREVLHQSKHKHFRKPTYFRFFFFKSFVQFLKFTIEFIFTDIHLVTRYTFFFKFSLILYFYIALFKEVSIIIWSINIYRFVKFVLHQWKIFTVLQIKNINQFTFKRKNNNFEEDILSFKFFMIYILKLSLNCINQSTENSKWIVLFEKQNSITNCR